MDTLDTWQKSVHQIHVPHYTRGRAHASSAPPPPLLAPSLLASLGQETYPCARVNDISGLAFWKFPQLLSLHVYNMPRVSTISRRHRPPCPCALRAPWAPTPRPRRLISNPPPPNVRVAKGGVRIQRDYVPELVDNLLLLNLSDTITSSLRQYAATSYWLQLLTGA